MLTIILFQEFQENLFKALTPHFRIIFLLRKAEVLFFFILEKVHSRMRLLNHLKLNMSGTIFCKNVDTKKKFLIVIVIIGLEYFFQFNSFFNLIFTQKKLFQHIFENPR